MNQNGSCGCNRRTQGERINVGGCGCNSNRSRCGCQNTCRPRPCPHPCRPKPCPPRPCCESRCEKRAREIYNEGVERAREVYRHGTQKAREEYRCCMRNCRRANNNCQCGCGHDFDNFDNFESTVLNGCHQPEPRHDHDCDCDGFDDDDDDYHRSCWNRDVNDERYADQPIAMAYVPGQHWGCVMDREEGFCKGTIFEDLYKPFKGECK